MKVSYNQACRLDRPHREHSPVKAYETDAQPRASRLRGCSLRGPSFVPAVCVVKKNQALQQLMEEEEGMYVMLEQWVTHTELIFQCVCRKGRKQAPEGFMQKSCLIKDGGIKMSKGR